MTWKDALIRDVENVLKGKQEDGLNTDELDIALTHIRATDDKDAIIQLLSQHSLGWFAHQVNAGTYDAIVEVENASEESEEA